MSAPIRIDFASAFLPAPSPVCPLCGKRSKTYYCRKQRRACLACVPCDMATDASGKWTFYVGGISA